MHLDKFIHPNSEQNVLYPYRKGSGSLRPTGTKHLASADHFYLQQESGQVTNRLDESRKQNEAVFFASGKRTSGPLARCVYEDDFKPTYDEKIMLAGSAAFLRCGSPAQVHNTAMLAVLANQIYAFNLFNTTHLNVNMRNNLARMQSANSKKIKRRSGRASYSSMSVKRTGSNSDLLRLKARKPGLKHFPGCD